MKFCRHCGFQLNDNDKFCSNCGTSCSFQKTNINQCPNCGIEVKLSSMFCPNCGAKINDNPTFNHSQNQGFGLGDQYCNNGNNSINMTNSDSQETINTIAKIFMVIATVTGGFVFLPSLCWCIPMTASLFNKIKNREKISVAFKICTLIFVTQITGILLLCRKEDEYRV